MDISSRISDVDDSSDKITTAIDFLQHSWKCSVYTVLECLICSSELGTHVVTIEVRDTYDVNKYNLTIDVYDSIPFIISKTDSESAHMIVTFTDLYITNPEC